MADKRTRWIIEATSNIPDVNKQLERLIQLQQTQNELTQQNTTSTALAIQRQREQIEQLSSAQTKANTTTSQGVKQQSDMMGALRKEYDLLSKTLSGLAQLAAGAWAVNQLKTYVMEVIAAKSAQDGFVASMEQMLGSRLKAEELNAKLMEIAQKSPFTIDQIQEVTKKLQGMGVETNKLIPYVNMLGDIASVVGTQKLPLIAKAMTDVQNKGILMGQEIKQFTENGIPLFDLLAKSMQKPREEVVKLAHDHKIAFADVEKALMQSTQKGGLYYGQMAVQAEQLGGKVANLADKYTLAKAKVGDFFENGIKKGIGMLGDLIDATIGSASAIERLTKYFSAALTMWVAYRAAVLSTSAALKANQVATLQDLAAKEASTLATVTMSTATTGLRASLSGLWTVMKANPWGALITVITAAIGVYQMWGAAQTEVISALGEEEIKLKNQKQLFNDSVLAVMALKEGTDKRRIAMESLISNYPEYFRGLSAEGTNNATLNKILGQVNNSYKERIDLARQAYNISKLEEKRSELLKEEFELMERIKMRSPELYKQINGDSEKLMEALRKGGTSFLKQLEGQGSLLKNVWDNAMNGSILKSADAVSKGLKEVDREILAASQRRETLSKKEQQNAVAAENTRWTAVSAQMKKGSKEYEAAQADHEKKVQELAGKTSTQIHKFEDSKVAKKKSTLELSLENDLKELKSVEQTYMQKMKVLEKEEELQKEIARRTITSQTDLHNRLTSLTLQYAAKREEIMRKEIESRIDYDMKDLKAAQAASDKYIAIKEKEAEEIENLDGYVAALQEKQRLEDIDKAIKTHDRLVDITKRAYEEMAKQGAMEAGENKKFWETREGAITRYWIKVKEQEIEGYKEIRKQRADHMAKMLELYGGNSEEYESSLADFLVNEEDLAEATKQYEGFQANLSEMNANWFAELVKLAQMGFEAYYNAINKGLEQIDSAYENAIAAYDGLKEANEEAMDAILADTTLTYEQTTEALKNAMETQRQILRAQNDFEYLRGENAEYMKELKDGFEETSAGFSAITSALNGDIGATIGSLVKMFSDMGTHWKEQLALREQNEQESIIRMNERRLYQWNLELQQAQELLQKKFELWDQELEKFRETKNAEIAALEERFAKEKSLMEQSSSDKQLRLQEDDVFRAQLMAQGEAREVAMLEAAKQREIAEAQRRNVSSEEIARITNAFNELITQKHAEYSDARGNKDKETSLAIQEQKAQEKDKILELEGATKDQIQVLKDQILKLEQQVSADKQAAQKEYADYVKHTQGQMFEAERQMAIAQLRVEIALLKSKRNIFNRGKINEAIGDLEAAIGEMGGIGNPYGYENPSRGDGSGGTTPRPNTPRGNDPDDDGRTNGPRPGFNGDPWLTRAKWDPDAKYGLDEIYMRTHEGERLMPLYLNQHLGANVSNEQLVHGYLQYANFMDRMPDTSVAQIPQMVLPEFSVSNQNVISMDRVERKLDQLNNTFANKSLLQVNIDGNAVSISEQWESHKATYYDTLFKQ
ncbi:tape measure protein [Dyadobacter alkalitolerans]|uniref:tape measure protein n=1 Tax=Dyadobacter alkalitolerans TaxID=492736 RepID=UPI000403774F|nr:tape measure protein [Dyadobacter alkalitolerans]